jgi:periplasmic protein CpxP/Spy
MISTLSTSWRRRAATALLVGATGLSLYAVLPGVASAAGGGHGGMHGGSTMGGPGMMMGRGLDRMLDLVDASAEQRSQIAQIRDATRADLKALHESGRGLREQGLALFVQPTVDANAVEALRLQQQALHEQASKRMSQSMLELSRVLSPQQRQQIATHMQERMAKMKGRHDEHQRSGG